MRDEAARGRRGRRGRRRRRGLHGEDVGGAHEDAPLVVTVDAQGTLRLGPEATPVTFDRLKQELASAVAAKPQLKLALNADKGAPFGQIVKVMDAAKEAHINTVSAFTK